MGYGIVADASGNATVTGRTASADFPVSTPTSDEIRAVVAALLAGGGRFGAITPERIPNALHGHVAHLVEETPTSLAHGEAAGQARAGAVYVQRLPPTNAGQTVPSSDIAEIREAVRVELSLTSSFTTEQFRAALGYLRGRRGLASGALPTYTCTRRTETGTGFMVPYPADLPRVEQEHATYHGLARILLKHQPLTDGAYSAT